MAAEYILFFRSYFYGTIFIEKDLDKPGWRVYNNKSPEGGTAGKQPIDTPMPKVGGV